MSTYSKDTWPWEIVKVLRDAQRAGNSAGMTEADILLVIANTITSRGNIKDTKRKVPSYLNTLRSQLEINKCGMFEKVGCLYPDCKPKQQLWRLVPNAQTENIPDVEEYTFVSYADIDLERYQLSEASAYNIRESENVPVAKTRGEKRARGGDDDAGDARNTAHARLETPEGGAGDDAKEAAAQVAAAQEAAARAAAAEAAKAKEAAAKEAAAKEAMGAAATTRRSNIPVDDYLRANRAALEATCGTAVHAVIAERAVDPVQALAMHVWQLANDARRERRASAVAAPADEDEELEPLNQMDGKWHFCQWMRGSTAVAGIVASAVRQTSPHPLPDAKAELAYVKSRFGGSKEDFVMRLLSGPLMRRIIDELWDAAGKLADEEVVVGGSHELHGKFLQDGAGLLSYSGLDTFFAGLEGMIGAPSPDARAAMAAEHTERTDSHEDFHTSNYGITTRSSIEWAFVVQPPSSLAPTSPLARPPVSGGRPPITEWPAVHTRRAAAAAPLKVSARPDALPLADAAG